MRLIDQYSIGKTGKQKLCEDLFLCNSNFAAVIDGATNVSGGLYGDKTPGRVAAEVILEAIENSKADASLPEVLSKINENMQHMHQMYGIEEEIAQDVWKAPSASLVLYSKFHQQIWQVGDCQFMIDGVLYQNEKEVDRITAEARSMYLEAELKQGKTIDDLLENDTGWKFILPLIRQQYHLQNDPDNQYGYEVINGYPIDETKIKITSVPKTAKELVLASDGYPFLRPSLEESETLLDDLMKDDPLCFRQYKSAKGLKKGNLSFDDRTYIKLSLES